ncbi:MAG: FGGY-family carbohydrate kinase [Gammaproteobacteria bacterium]
MSVAVFDAGITHLKLLVIDASGRVRFRRVRPTPTVQAPPYRHLDTETAWDWLVDSLARAAHEVRIQAVVPCSHGSAVALIDEEALVLPVMHYESEPPKALVEEYASLAPPFEEACAPVNPAAMTLALQLFWQSREFPRDYERAVQALPYAQYWAWRLCGRAATEVTSLGAQTQVWAPIERSYTSLAVAQGWDRLFAPLHPAWESLGPLHESIVRRTAVPADTPVLTGIHDSSANYLRYVAAGKRDFTLMSTGTWIINFNASCPLHTLDPRYDTNTNTSVRGAPIACSRFMGGREYEIVSGGTRAMATRSGVEAIVRNRVYALPSFTDSGGPVPGTGACGRIVGALEGEPAKAALATIYCALMANRAVGHISAEHVCGGDQTDSEIVIDGAFTANAPFCRLIAALNPGRRVSVARTPEGTAQGAAALWGLERRSRAEVKLDLAEPLPVPGLERYVLEWSQQLGSM